MAERVRALLEEDHDFEVYMAASQQSLQDLMIIIDDLARSDYFLFIDFDRDKLDGAGPGEPLRHSIFSHQELAIAHYVGIENVIILQEESLDKRPGMMDYLLSNPLRFKDAGDLVDTVKSAIEDREWSGSYSRNIVFGGLRRKPVKGYADHATPDGIAHREVILHGVIENRRDKTPARDTICVLRSIEVLEGECNIEDSSPLKWARHNRQYSQTILPGDSRKVDLLAYRPDPTGSDPGIFLHSQQDFKPRKPLITAEGTYRLAYEVYAREFPPLRFSVTLDYRDDSVHVQGPPATGIEVWPPTVDVSRTEQAQAAYEHHLPAESEERD